MWKPRSLISRWYNSAKQFILQNTQRNLLRWGLHLKLHSCFVFLIFLSLISFFKNYFHVNLQLRGTQSSFFVHSAPDTLVSLLLLANMPQYQRFVTALVFAGDVVFPHVDVVCFFISFRSFLKYHLIREVFHGHLISLAPLSTSSFPLTILFCLAFIIWHTIYLFLIANWFYSDIDPMWMTNLVSIPATFQHLE